MKMSNARFRKCINCSFYERADGGYCIEKDEYVFEAWKVNDCESFTPIYLEAAHWKGDERFVELWIGDSVTSVVVPVDVAKLVVEKITALLGER